MTDVLNVDHLNFPPRILDYNDCILLLLWKVSGVIFDLVALKSGFVWPMPPWTIVYSLLFVTDKQSVCGMCPVIVKTCLFDHDHDQVVILIFIQISWISFFLFIISSSSIPALSPVLHLSAQDMC